MAATHRDIGVSQPASSTITFKVATVELTRNSTAQQQELLTLADPETTNALARVLSSSPVSTEWGLTVRIASGPSSAADLQATVTPVANSTWRTQPGSTAWATSAGFHFDSSGALQVTGATASTVVTVARMVGNSSAADFMPVRIVDSSGTGFLTPGNEYADGSTYSTKTGPSLTYDNSSNQTMRMVGLATPWPVQVTDSSNAAVKPGDSANNALRANVVAGSVRVSQSTASDLLMTARVNTSSGGGVEGSTTAPAVGVTGLHVRQVYPTLQSTTVQITSTHSTAVYALISSAAGLRHKVYAYIVQSTHTLPSTLVFMSSLAIDRWPVMFGSGSSGVTGANLALSPPGWIFHADAANALNVRVEGGSSVTSTVIVRIGLAWFDEA